MIISRLGRTYQLTIIASLAVATILAALALTDVGTTLAVGQRVHVAIQTCGAIVLCFAAFLVFERFHADARARAARLAPTPQRIADVDRGRFSHRVPQSRASSVSADEARRRG